MQVRVDLLRFIVNVFNFIYNRKLQMCVCVCVELSTCARRL